jgi:phiEco32-like amidoligase-type 2 protein
MNIEEAKATPPQTEVRPLTMGTLLFGCDPELFATKDGKIIGSDQLIPPEGLKYTGADGGKIVRDGVQLELNPGASHCRANLSNTIQGMFAMLNNHLKKVGAELSFEGTITLNKKTFDSLNPACRQLGCMPSLNIYEEKGLGVNPMTYRRRSAGGHIHIGLEGSGYTEAQKIQLVGVMDAIPGLISVLIDRDPNAAIRRRVYGRAGEYRLPKHGVEYRTLSNFWLRHYALMSLMMGLTRLSVGVLYTTYKASNTVTRSFYGARYKDHPFYKSLNIGADGYSNIPPARWDALSYLYSLIDREKVRKAINTSNYDLAFEQWRGVRKFIHDTCPTALEAGLDRHKLDAFDYFLKVIRDEGIQKWFPQDPLTHWCNKAEGHGTGWEAFITTTVPAAKQRNEAQRIVIS